MADGNRQGEPVPVWYEPAVDNGCLVEHRSVEAAHGVLGHGVEDEARHELGVDGLAGLGVDAGDHRIALVVDLAEFRNRALVGQFLECGNLGGLVGIGNLLNHLFDAMVDTEIAAVHTGDEIVVLGVAEDVDE